MHSSTASTGQAHVPLKSAPTHGGIWTPFISKPPNGMLSIQLFLQNSIAGSSSPKTQTDTHTQITLPATSVAIVHIYALCASDAA